MVSRRTSTSPTTDPALLDVGRIVKPHGLTGEVVVELYADRSTRLDPGAVFSSARGALRVESARPFGGRYLVRFEGVSGREDAEGWRGVVLRAEPLDEPDTLWVHELVGAEVVDAAGTVLGRIGSVEPNPASDLLVLEDGGLIPLRFVTESEPGRRVVVDIPAGLLE
jgi:16S rRNA processing protein RimM